METENINIPMTDSERVVAAADTIKNLRHALDGMPDNAFLNVAKAFAKEALTILEDGERSL